VFRCSLDSLCEVKIGVSLDRCVSAVGAFESSTPNLHKYEEQKEEKGNLMSRQISASLRMTKQ
jgi:hypothetical protein